MWIGGLRGGGIIIRVGGSLGKIKALYTKIWVVKLWKCLIIYVNWVRLYIWELGWFWKNDFLVWNGDGFWELIIYII